MTKAQIINDIKALIGPGNPMQDSQLLTWLNDKYMYACDMIAQDNPDYFAKKSFTDLKAGQIEYEVPPDFERALMVNANLSGVWRRLEPLPFITNVAVAETPSNPQNFTVSNPVYYRVDNKLGILPAPDADVTDGLDLWYIYTPVELASDGDSPAIPSKYHHLLKYGVYADFLNRDDQHQPAMMMRQNFEDKVEKMVMALSSMSEEEPKSIEIVQDQNLYYHDNDYN